MPRAAQNPYHPLTRLRRQLSTPGHTVTREELAKRTGIPLGSIKSIESGKYALTNHLALKISLAVPVNPYDLFKGREPLRDFTGRPLSAQSVSLEVIRNGLGFEPLGAQTPLFVAETIFEAAKQKAVSIQFRFLFYEALVEAVELLGLQPLVAQALSGALGDFDPAQVPEPLCPLEGEAAKRWERFVLRVRQERERLWIQRQDQEPAFGITPEMDPAEKARLNAESAKFEEDLWAEALATVGAVWKKGPEQPAEAETPAPRKRKRP